MRPPITQIGPKHKSGALPLAVRRAGQAALAALRAPGSGRVLATFRRSFYVETPAGLACVGPAELGDGPLNALCNMPAALDWEALGIAPGSTVDVATLVHLAAAEAWAPSTPALTSPAPVPAARLGDWRRAAAAYARTDGLAPLVADPDRVDTPVLRAARAPIGELDRWFAAATAECPPPGILGLLGLGPGLTPSGDDYLAGAMIALRAIGRGDRADALAKLVLGAAAERTSRLSAAHLACAAAGEGAGALHDALARLLGAAEDSPEPALAALDAIGHSSGWDALAGAFAVLRPAAG
jgi:hypothetical protein